MRTVRVRGIIQHDNRYLFVKHMPSSDYWALPGGGLDDGETLEAGLTRECVEELGVTPLIGRLLYVQQLFIGDDESLEFFFEITNGADYTAIDLRATTHGHLELSAAAFIDPAEETVLPEFLSSLDADMRAHDWPKVFVRSAPGAIRE